MFQLWQPLKWHFATLEIRVKTSKDHMIFNNEGHDLIFQVQSWWMRTSCPARSGMYSIIASLTLHLVSSASSTIAGSRLCDNCLIPITWNVKDEPSHAKMGLKDFCQWKFRTFTFKSVLNRDMHLIGANVESSTSLIKGNYFFQRLGDVDLYFRQKTLSTWKLFVWCKFPELPVMVMGYLTHVW